MYAAGQDGEAEGGVVRYAYAAHNMVVVLRPGSSELPRVLAGHTNR